MIGPPGRLAEVMRVLSYAEAFGAPPPETVAVFVTSSGALGATSTVSVMGA
jgi:hypothetical protein